MALKIGNNEVENLAVGATELDALMLGSNLVWEKAQQRVIYGWHVDPSISNPSNAITYLNDAVGKTPAAMGSSEFNYGDWTDAFFMPKPCMLKFDGTVDYYLDPNDFTKKADGTNSDIADPNYGGNAMMEWGLIWYKFEAGSASGEGNFYVANYKVDNTYHCWCNYDANDNIIEHFYTAIYNGTGTSKMRSISGVRLTSGNGNGNTTGQQEVDRALANNTNQTVEWYTDVLCDRLLINALLILISKSLNTQAKFGNGITDGGQSAKQNYTTGNLNDKGLFWGDTTNKTQAVKVFGMENWWGCVYRRTAGLVGTSSSNYAIKLTYGMADGSTSNGYSSNGTGYITKTGLSTSSSFIKTMQFNEQGYFPLSTEYSTGAEWRYWCDYVYYTNQFYACFGGNTNIELQAGANNFDLSTAFNDSNWYYSTTLSCKPLAQN